MTQKKESKYLIIRLRCFTPRTSSKMARISNNKSALLVLTLALLLVFTIAESRTVFPRKLAKASVPTCDSVFGVRSGDTCFSIAQSFALSNAEFSSINPNVDCAALFVGQWLCVVGSA